MYPETQTWYRDWDQFICHWLWCYSVADPILIKQSTIQWFNFVLTWKPLCIRLWLVSFLLVCFILFFFVSFLCEFTKLTDLNWIKAVEVGVLQGPVLGVSLLLMQDSMGVRRGEAKRSLEMEYKSLMACSKRSFKAILLQHSPKLFSRDSVLCFFGAKSVGITGIFPRFVEICWERNFGLWF